MMDPSQPIRRRKLSDDVRERLLLLIRERKLRPGDAIPSERELMAQYGVGRPAIREAMQALQSMGLIDIRHGERPRVAEPSVGQMLGQIGEPIRHMLVNSDTTLENLKEARALFEAQMAGLAAANATPESVGILDRILDEQVSARREPDAFLACDGRFHAQIATMSGNPIFAALSRSLFDWLAEFHSDLMRAPKLEQLTINEHTAILEAIRSGDAELAASRMTDHLNRANDLYHAANLA